MSAIKTAVVVAKVLYELLQQQEESQEELSQMILSIDDCLHKLDTVLLGALITGLEFTVASLKRLESWTGRLLFSYDAEAERISNNAYRLYIIQQALLAATQGEDQRISCFNVLDMLRSEDAKQFWEKHFSTKIHVVRWDKFQACFEQEKDLAEFSTPLLKNKLKRILDRDAQDQVSIYSFGDLTDTVGWSAAVKSLHNTALPELATTTVLKSNSDVVVEDTVWRGVVSQSGCGDRDIILCVLKRDNSALEGHLHWPHSSNDTQTKIRGSVSGKDVQFEEFQVLQGTPVIPFPNIYIGKVDDSERTAVIFGEWSQGNQKGTFELFLMDYSPIVAAKRAQVLLAPPPTSTTTTPATIQVNVLKRTESFAANTPVSNMFSGYLTKQGGLRKNWLTRYFVLRSGILGYYKSKEDYPHSPCGTIDINKITAVRTCTLAAPSTSLSNLLSHSNNNSSGHSFMFEIVTPGRTFYVQAESEQNRKEWLEVIQNEINKFQQQEAGFEQ